MDRGEMNARFMVVVDVLLIVHPSIGTETMVREHSERRVKRKRGLT